MKTNKPIKNDIGSYYTTVTLSMTNDDYKFIKLNSISASRLLRQVIYEIRRGKFKYDDSFGVNIPVK